MSTLQDECITQKSVECISSSPIHSPDPTKIIPPLNFIAIDFETANSNRSSACSLGIAMIHNGKLLDTAHFLIKPTPNYYDGFNSAFHGISDRHTRNAPTFAAQWEDLKVYFEGLPIVAHNAAFDCSVLRAVLDASGLDYPNFDYHCTYALSKHILPLSSHKLDAVARHFKIDLQHHQAESDARAAALIAVRLCEQNSVDSLDALAAKIGFKVGKIMGETQSYRPFSKR